MKRWPALAALIVLIAALAWNEKTLGVLRGDHDRLRADSQEANRLRGENQALAAARPSDPSRLSLADKRELMRLRNEVGRLRASHSESARLLAENARLQAALEAAKERPAQQADARGFLGREQWSNAGFGSPEATVQTFFWAIRDENLEEMVKCFLPEEAAELARQIDPTNPQRRKEMVASLGNLARLRGLRVADRAPAEEGKVVLGIQAVNGGEIMHIRLKQAEGAWKLDHDAFMRR